MISESMLPVVDLEMANTRKALERVPDDKFDWRPHPKSFTLGTLAAHIATIPSWGAIGLTTDELDIQPPGAPPFQPPSASSRGELLAMFDESAAKFRAALADASDAHIMESWSLLRTGQTMFTKTRMEVIRDIVMSHIIHHRGQLTVYLRLLDLPVPAIYGPSADEGKFF